MKHLEKISRSKQKKPTYSPRGQVGKIITLSLIGVGVYLLISRRKAFAEEIPEEFIPAEKPQDQLTQQLYEQLPPSTIVERATEEARIEAARIAEAERIAPRNLIQLSSSTHSYTGLHYPPRGGPNQISGGEKSIDGNWDTYFGLSAGGGDGGVGIELISEHTFAKPSFVQEVKYSMYASASASGRYRVESSYTMYVQYQPWGGSWIDVSGSRNSGGGSYKTGSVSFPLNKDNIQKIRAYCRGDALATGGEGSVAVVAQINEIQAIGYPQT